MCTFRGFLFGVCCSLLLLFLSFSSCRKDAPPEPPQTGTITLEAVDASCTEAWLRLRLTSSLEQRAWSLTRNGRTVLSALTSPLDTLVVDEGLLPNRTYTYKAYRLADSRLTDSSTQVTLTTLDTTSGNWNFQINTLGDGSSSVLYDVCILSDTLAYAVGAVYLTGDPHAYNMAKWNGQQWELMRIQFYTICGQTSRTPYPAKAIFAFSEADIWIAMDGDQVARWNGTTQTATMCLPVSFAINKLWGESPNSVYAVGEGGNIMHYASGTWRRLESGTTLDVYDIWGATNQRIGETEIYAVAAKQFVTFDRRILKITPAGVTVVSDSTIPYSLHGVWFKGGGPYYYVVGSGMYRKHDPIQPGPWQSLHPGATPYYTYAIRANDVNDIFVSGSFGELLHFNGFSFRSYQNTPGFAALEFYEVSCRGNLVIAVGYVQPRAVAVIGRRTR